MNESTTRTTNQFTGCASLAALGVKLTGLKLFEPIRQRVQIAQKTIKHRLTDKLYDALISLREGAQRLVGLRVVAGHKPACGIRIVVAAVPLPCC